MVNGLCNSAFVFGELLYDGFHWQDYCDLYASITTEEFWKSQGCDLPVCLVADVDLT